MEVEICEGADGFEAWGVLPENFEKAVWGEWDVEILNPPEVNSSASRTDEVYQIKARADRVTGKKESKFFRFHGVRFMTASGWDNVNASGGVQVDISLGGGKEKTEITVSGRAEVSDDRGNGVSVSASHNTSTQETNISIGANVSTKSESPCQQK